MSETKRLIKNTGIIAIGSMSTKVISFLLLPMYTALLSANEYGNFDYIISVCTFSLPFITFLMEEGIFRFLLDCKNEQEKKEVITIGSMFVCIGTIIFGIICAIIFSFVGYEYKAYFVLYTISCVGCAILNPFLRGIGNVKGYAVFNFLLSAITIILNVLFIAGFHWGLKGMLLATIVAHYAITIIFAIKVKIYNYISFKTINKVKMIEMFKYSIPLIPNKISWAIINLCDRIMLMHMVGSSATGLYAVAYKFPNLMDMVYGFFYQSWKESSARILETGTANEFYNNIYRCLKRALFAIVVVMVAFMPLAFKIMIDESYIDALQYVPFLLIATYYANISGFYGGIFTAYKETKIMGTTTIVAAIINLLINIVAMWKIGIYAAAISTLISNFIVYIYRKVKVRKYIKLDEDFLETVISWGTLTIIIILFYINSILSLSIACVLALVMALILNKEMILQVWKKIVKKKLIR